MKKWFVLIICIVFGLTACNPVAENENTKNANQQMEETEHSKADEESQDLVPEQDGEKEYQWIPYSVDIEKPKMMDQVSYIRTIIDIPEGAQVTILDHALYVDGKTEKWSVPLALHGDVRVLTDSQKPGKHYVIVFNAPLELVDFSDDHLSLTFYVSMEVDGYQISFMEENQKNLSLPAKPRELEGIGWINGMKIIAEYKNTGDDPYEVMLVQTEVLPPLTPDDQSFDMYLSGFYGGFDLLLVKQGEIIDSLNFNECFGYEKIGFIGPFSICGADYNDDGNLDFNIGIIDKRGSATIFFTVEEDALQIFTFDGESLVMVANPHHSETYQPRPDGGLVINRPGEYMDEYVWDGRQFVTKENE